MKELKTPEDILKWMEGIGQYEEFHENPKIHLTREEIVQMFKDTFVRLRDSVLDDEKYTPFERRMLFIKRCVVHQILDDLLCVPNDIRPWTSDEQRWLAEMTEREKAGWHDRKSESKKRTAYDVRMEEILRNISE